MKLVTSETMRAIDAFCIEALGIPGQRLMESAGVGTARFIEQRSGRRAEGPSPSSAGRETTAATGSS